MIGRVLSVFLTAIAILTQHGLAEYASVLTGATVTASNIGTTSGPPTDLIT